MHLGDVIKKYRKDNRMSMQAFADICELSKGYIAMLERNVNSKTGEPVVPSLETFVKVSRAMGVPLSSVLDMVDENQPIAIHEDIKDFKKLPANLEVFRSEPRTIPVLGAIACGKPIFADEEREYITVEHAPKQTDYILTARGDSMIGARIHDGDYVFIHKQPTVDDGDIAAVVIDDEATLKRVYFDRKRMVLTLVAENPAYAPLVYSGDQLNDVVIIGRAIAFQSVVR